MKCVFFALLASSGEKMGLLLEWSRRCGQEWFIDDMAQMFSARVVCVQERS